MRSTTYLRMVYRHNWGSVGRLVERIVNIVPAYYYYDFTVAFNSSLSADRCWG